MIINGRYEVIEEIGRGSLGVLYKAHDVQTDGVVALKLLSTPLAEGAPGYEQLVHALQRVARLTHPAIVPVYESGSDGEQFYIVTRYVHGASLKERLETGDWPITQMWDTLQRVAKALDDAARQGIVHGDVKPSNILFDSSDTPYLSDFAIARVLDEVAGEASNRLSGSPVYMSPELFSGGDLSQCDQYSLALIVFEALTGRPPFQGSTTQLMYQHVHERPPDVADYNQDVPSDFSPILRRALAKNPADRFASATAFVNALQMASSANGSNRVVSLVAASASENGPITAEKKLGQQELLENYQEGLLAIEAGNWRRAAIVLERVVRETPDYRDANLHLERARREVETLDRKARRQKRRHDTETVRRDSRSTEKPPAGGVPKRSNRRYLYLTGGLGIVLTLLAFVWRGILPTGSPAPTEASTEVVRVQTDAAEAEDEPATPAISPVGLTVVEAGSDAYWESPGAGGRIREASLWFAAQPLRVLNRNSNLRLALEPHWLLIMDDNSDVVIEGLVGHFDAERTDMALRDGRLLLQANDTPVAVHNPFGATALMSTGVMGVTYSSEPYLFRLSCLVGNCLLRGETGDERRLRAGESSTVDGSGMPGAVEVAAFEMYAWWGQPIVPTPTPTSTATATATATRTPRPTQILPSATANQLPTATATNSAPATTEGVPPPPPPPTDPPPTDPPPTEPPPPPTIPTPTEPPYPPPTEPPPPTQQPAPTSYPYP